jgi:hypothetical protein
MPGFGTRLAPARRMKIVRLLMVGLCGSSMAVAACGGATVATGGEPAATGATTPPGGDDGVPPPSAPPSTTAPGPGLGGESCLYPTLVLVASGGTIARAAGPTLRLELVYQGSSIGVTRVRGLDRGIPPSSGPFTVGEVAGYWVEARSGTTTTYQQYVQDPTVAEGLGGPSGAGSTATLPVCEPKPIIAELPNEGTTEVIVYGSPYGTNAPAGELARFTVK